MASSATQNVSGNAHIQALHSKTHHKPTAEKPVQGENFAEMLAETGDSQPQKPVQPKEKSAHTAQQASHGAKTETAPEASEAALVKGEVSEADLEATVEPEVLAEDAKPAANDNETSADLALQTTVPQAQAKPKEATTPGSQDTGEAPGAIKPAALTPANDVAIDDAAPEGEQGATGEAKAAPEFEAALQDAKAEPRANPAEATAPKPVEMKPAADIATLALSGNTTTPGIEKPAHASQAAAQNLQAPLPSPDVNQFAVEVAAKSQAGAKQFDIRLDPPELGRVDVRLSIDASGKAEAHLTADQPATLDLLQKDASVLARALRDAGLNLSQDGLNFSLKSQQQQAGDDSARHHGGRMALPQRAINEPAETVAPVRHAIGLLDIRV